MRSPKLSTVIKKNPPTLKVFLQPNHLIEVVHRMAFQSTVITKPAGNIGSITYKWIYVFIYLSRLCCEVCDRQTSQPYKKGKESCWLGTKYEQEEPQKILSQRQGIRSSRGTIVKAQTLSNIPETPEKFSDSNPLHTRMLEWKNTLSKCSGFLPNRLVTINDNFCETSADADRQKEN